jgi:hypothetical protein
LRRSSLPRAEISKPFRLKKAYVRPMECNSKYPAPYG